ncbi:MFS transporter [Candidatus Ruminimicrobiellum ovillum]|uniref:MFS transporter n=1 Tax=Candidatus Ruminimicrobiellum ovillum TaxID=1947927 RepID=UPI0035597907
MNNSKRYLYLIVGTIALLFAGTVYAWSILKVPLAQNFGWTVPQLTVNFTLTMSFFCLGGILGSLLNKKIGLRNTLIISAILSGAGFIFTSFLSGSSISMLYVWYGIICGLGIGIAYNNIISTVNQWFLDKKGFSSGVLLMGYGASSLIIGSIAAKTIANANFGWRNTYLSIGICLFIVLFACALILKTRVFDNTAKAADTAALQVKDYTLAEMLKSISFWKALLVITFLAACGNTVISIAKDISLASGLAETLAVTMVGVLSVCNGLGRIICGLIFDKFGCKKTMIYADVLTIIAGIVILVAVMNSSVILCIAGLCIVGLSFGCCPTISAAFIADFFGKKNYNLNYSVFNLNLLIASLIASLESYLLAVSGGYTVPFLVLIALAVVALGITLSIKKS